MDSNRTSLFQSMAVIGLGLMGGSLVKAFRRVGVPLRMIGVDRLEVLDQARDFLDESIPPDHLEAAVTNADLIILSTPIQQIQALIPKVAAAMKPGSLLTDLGSTKAEIADFAKKSMPSDRYFIGGHPMTGSEKSGWENADPFLFENALYLLTPSGNAPPELTDRLVRLLHEIGAQVLVMSPEEHDRIAAEVSHVPQLLAVALTNFIARAGVEREPRLRLAAGGFRDMTRIAASPFGVWQDILNSNRKNIVDGIDGLIAILNEMKTSLAGMGQRNSAPESETHLQIAFESAASIRNSIPKDTRGFLQPHYDMTVVAPDQPGVIAKISIALALEGLNIKDIEVLKVREGFGGTLRLAFDSEASRTRALSILTGVGFACSRRD